MQVEELAMSVAAFEAWVTDGQEVPFRVDKPLLIAIIGNLQLSFRHPANNGASRQIAEKFVRDVIEHLDPSHGDLYKFLMLGFDPDADALTDLEDEVVAILKEKAEGVNA